jgi:hypothetical protein
LKLSGSLGIIVTALPLAVVDLSFGDIIFDISMELLFFKD